eukprot:scaffold14214_cov101-Isochrysis_galbana.AAC.1
MRSAKGRSVLEHQDRARARQRQQGPLRLPVRPSASSSESVGTRCDHGAWAYGHGGCMATLHLSRPEPRTTTATQISGYR